MATSAPLLGKEGKAAHSKASIFYGADEYLEELGGQDDTSKLVAPGCPVVDTGQGTAKYILFRGAGWWLWPTIWLLALATITCPARQESMQVWASSGWGAALVASCGILGAGICTGWLASALFVNRSRPTRRFGRPLQLPVRLRLDALRRRVRCARTHHERRRIGKKRARQLGWRCLRFWASSCSLDWADDAFASIAGGSDDFEIVILVCGSCCWLLLWCRLA